MLGLSPCCRIPKGLLFECNCLLPEIKILEGRHLSKSWDFLAVGGILRALLTAWGCLTRIVKKPPSLSRGEDVVSQCTVVCTSQLQLGISGWARTSLSWRATPVTAQGVSGSHCLLRPLWYFLFVLNYVYSCRYVHVSVSTLRALRCQVPLELEWGLVLSVPAWVLGIELRFSARALCALDCRVISSASKRFFFK